MPLLPSSKKDRSSSEEAPGDRLLRARHKEEERLVHDQDSRSSVQEERLSEAPPRQRVQREGEADLLVGADVRSQTRLSSIQNSSEESTRKDGRWVGGKGGFVQGRRRTGGFSCG